MSTTTTTTTMESPTALKRASETKRAELAQHSAAVTTLHSTLRHALLDQQRALQHSLTNLSLIAEQRHYIAQLSREVLLLKAEGVGVEAPIVAHLAMWRLECAVRELMALRMREGVLKVEVEEREREVLVLREGCEREEGVVERCRRECVVLQRELVELKREEVEG